MSPKTQGTTSALEAAERCVKAIVEAAVADPSAFTNAWNACQDALDDEKLSNASRAVIERLAVAVVAGIVDFRESAQASARAETDAAVKAAIKERIRIELSAVGLSSCVVAFSVFCYFGWSVCAFGSLLCALYILGFPQLFKYWAGSWRGKNSPSM